MDTPQPLKLLILDIETAPHRAYVWSLFDQNRIPDEMIEEPGYTLCASWQWYGEKKVRFETIRRKSSEKARLPALRRLAKAINDADGIITYNGQKFDIPILRREFLEADIQTPSLPVSIDLYRHAVTKLHFASGKMGYVAKRLKVKIQKIRHRGMDLWFGCMRGDRKSWREMRQYNMQDVKVTALLYPILRPYLGKANHPDAALPPVSRLCPDTERPDCKRCGRMKMQQSGFRAKDGGRFRKYFCNVCGHTEIGKTNLLTKEQRQKLRAS